MTDTPTKSTIIQKGRADPVNEYRPALTNPAEIRAALRNAAAEAGRPVSEYILINTGPGYKAQTYYIEMRKEPTK